MKKIGFTLAEVLITLGIIGVVAALTIPNLLNQTNDTELKTAWKKAYSELNQAYQQLIIDNGGVDFSGQCANLDNECLRDLFRSKLKTIRTCDEDAIAECMALDAKFGDGTTTAESLGINNEWPAIVVSSSYAIKVRAHQQDCSYGFPRECGWMQVDVNGRKKPNIAGKDIFFLGLAKTKLVPMGAMGDSISTNSCAQGASGIGCSAKYLYSE